MQDRGRKVISNNNIITITMATMEGEEVILTQMFPDTVCPGPEMAGGGSNALLVWCQYCMRGEVKTEPDDCYAGIKLH